MERPVSDVGTILGCLCWCFCYVDYWQTSKEKVRFMLPYFNFSRRRWRLILYVYNFRYNLKEDVRQSLYDECNVWLRELKRKGTEFHGGIRPNLADLAVYGVLSSIEGCVAFRDVMENTQLGPWYTEMKRLISLQAGGPALAWKW